MYPTIIYSTETVLHQKTHVNKANAVFRPSIIRDEAVRIIFGARNNVFIARQKSTNIKRQKPRIGV